MERVRDSASPSTTRRIRHPGPGRPLPNRVRGRLEPALGRSLADVQVHDGARAADAAGRMGARAFTHDNHIFLGRGESATDVDLMAHEATHVVQQQSAPTVQRLIDLSLDDLPGIDAADIARRVPGFTLFTVVLGYNPITNESVEFTGPNLVQGLFELVPFGADIYDALAERGIIEDAFAWVQENMPDVSTERLTGLLEEAWDKMGITLSPAENIGVLISTFRPVASELEAFGERAVDKVIEFIKEVAIGTAEELLAENRAWDLIKKILGRDPLRDEEVEAEPAEILEDFLLLIGKEEHLEQMRERGTVEETAQWLVTQLETFQSLLGRLRGLVESAWEALQPANLPSLATSIESLGEGVATFLQDVWTFASTVAAEVLVRIKDALLGWLSDYANDVPGFHLLTVILGRDPFTEEPVPRTAENLIRGFITLLPGGGAVYQQLAETGVIGEAAGRIEGALESLGITWDFVVGLFTGIWERLSIESLADPVGTFAMIVEQFGEPITRLFAFVNVVLRELFAVLLAAMDFPTDIVGSIISNVISAIQDVRRDPIGFLMNMLQAIREGFQNFFGNIISHLAGGLADWLFRGLRGAGIEPPTDLSLESVLDFVLDVLGLTTERLWERLAERIGQENVDRIRGAIDRLTGVLEFVGDVQERGVVAIWEYVQGQLTGLWDMVLEKAREWIMERVITRAAQWLMSLLDPTGIMAVVNSVRSFIAAVQSAVEYARDILAIVADYTSTIAAVARGEIGPGAEKLEQGLANAIPIAIGFLMNQLGLGNVGEKIQEIVAGLRQTVDRALDWLIDRAVGAVESVLRTFGVGSQVEDETMDEGMEELDPYTAVQVAEALDSIPKREAQFVSEETLSRPEAEHVATEIREEYPVFRVFTVVDGGDSWNYHYEVNPSGEIDEGRPKKGEGVTPETKLDPRPSGGKANEVMVKPLAQDAETKGNPSTTAPTSGDEKLTVLNESLPGRSTNWVKLHLIHYRLGGPNQSWNLIPGTIAANNKMRDWAETPAISKLYGEEKPVMWYRTTVLSYHDDPFDAFVEKIKVEYGEYDVTSDTELTTVTPDTIQSSNPAEQYPDMPTANINTAGRVVLERIAGITTQEARVIAEETNHFGPFKSMKDMGERLSRRDEFGPDDIEWIKDLLRKGFLIGIPTVIPEWQREP